MIAKPMTEKHGTLEGEILYHEHGTDYEEVRRRRMLSFVVDYLLIALLCIPAALAVWVAGVITLGLAWILFAVLIPLVAVAYLGITMGGAKQATVGMAMFSLRIRRLDGGHIDAPLAILHGVVFWFIHSVLSPVMLIAALFSSRKRLLHDWLLGTEIVRSDDLSHYPPNAR